MFRSMRYTLATAAISGLLLSSTTASADDNTAYQVTITNITSSINFTPILVTSHRKGVSLYELGSPASDELTAIAEGGDTAPLAAVLDEDPRVVDVQNSGGLLEPGQSVTVTVTARRGARFISLASMMLPTNDGFIALNSVRAPRHGSVTYYSQGFDAGSEPNDELCISIPGPTCGGEGPSPGVDGEGYVHIHRGIHGIGDLAPEVYDWRNPVAAVTITRAHDD
ncbi:MAG: spondin domain-containing protein [Thiotrichales bacterium]|nr:MAG: spondin domain-containing protein [Thiotrichales bacterium]